jgi:hypothetical protein
MVNSGALDPDTFAHNMARSSAKATPVSGQPRLSRDQRRSAMLVAGCKTTNRYLRTP